MAESEEELKVMKVKQESGKTGLKFSIQKMKIMAYGPITSWQINGEKLETVTDFFRGDSKITADCDCSHEIKRCLLLGRKFMRNQDSILNSRGITLLTKVYTVKTMASLPNGSVLVYLLICIHSCTCLQKMHWIEVEGNNPILIHVVWVEWDLLHLRSSLAPSHRN